MKHLTIVTNFEGPHIGVPLTTLSSLDKLGAAIMFEKAEIISVVGGGDPLHEYEKHTKYFERLLRVCRTKGIPLEMHTSRTDTEFPYGKCDVVVYHISDLDTLKTIKRHADEPVRVVFTARKSCTLDIIDEVAEFCDKSLDINALYFRDSKYGVAKCVKEYLQAGVSEARWNYIEKIEMNPPFFVNGTIHYSWDDIFA